MIYGSVCSGIEAATTAWHPLGWTPSWFSEIEKFPSSVLAYHYPHVPNLGSMIGLHDNPKISTLPRINLLVGGTPCQSFSIAGLRGGLQDGRGNLALEYCLIAKALQPKWILWENVPGVLSSNEGKDFGSILGALVECGYGLCYRVLDAQNFGVPQRRRRVFIVGYLGDWRPAAAVLFEQESLCWNPGANEEAEQDDADSTEDSIDSSSGTGCIVSTMRMRGGCAGGGKGPLITQDKSLTLATANDQTLFVGSVVRRLTPIEFERLQGFPDHYTDIPGSTDATRYKALGNSMAVPVMNWIGRRIQLIEGEKNNELQSINP